MTRILFVKSKLLIWLIFSLFTGIFIIFILFIISNAANHRSNGFIRLFPPHLVSLKNILNLKYNSSYLAGASSDYVYLGDAKAVNNILRVNYSLTDTLNIRLSIIDKIKAPIGTARVIIDSPFLYIVSAGVPIISGGSFQTFNIKHLQDTGIYFTACLPISSNSFVIRVYDSHSQENVLGKETLLPTKINLVRSILDKQREGIFFTDGMLNYEADSGRLTYVYFYRNKFICLDTNLNILYTGRTIDTTIHPNIKIGTFTSGSSEITSTLLAKALTVNKRSYSARGWLFVNSALLANNENKDAFQESSVIDVYSIIDGKYHFSFYLPDYAGKKLSSFLVYRKTVIAIYDNYVLSYTIRI